MRRSCWAQRAEWNAESLSRARPKRLWDALLVVYLLRRSLVQLTRHCACALPFWESLLLGPEPALVALVVQTLLCWLLV